MAVAVAVADNGGRRETISMNQAQEIIKSANEIMNDCAKKMERRNDEFIEDLSRMWEDQNAVDYSKKHQKAFNNLVTQLNDNTKSFNQTVKDIADSYATAGGIHKKLELVGKQVIATFNISKIQDHFSEGEGDEFGFKDPTNGPEKVMDSFEELKNDLQKITLDTTNRIKTINAFGNKQVQLNLAKSAGKVVEILEESIEKVQKEIQNQLEKTATNYIRVGEESVEGALIGGASTEPLLYGPAPAPAPVPVSEVSVVPPTVEPLVYGPAPSPEVHIVAPEPLVYGPAPSPEVSIVPPTVEPLLYGPAPTMGPTGFVAPTVEPLVYGPAPSPEVHIVTAPTLEPLVYGPAPSPGKPILVDDNKKN